MLTRSSRGIIFLVVALVMASASGAAAQEPMPSASGSHSIWRDVLIGGVVGTGFGAGVGAMRKNFHTAECAVLACNPVLEADTLAPIGAAIGAFGGWLTHVVRNHMTGRSSQRALPGAAPAARSSRATTFVVTPTYSPDRKGIHLRAQF